MRIETKLGEIETFSPLTVKRTVATVRGELIKQQGLPYAAGYMEGLLLKSFSQLPESEKNKILLQMLDKVNLL